MVGSDEERTIGADLALLCPFPQDVVVLTTDADGADVEFDPEFLCHLCRRGTPVIAVLPDDQCERTVSRDVDGRDAASTLLDPRVG